jgi:hypothetical protein
LYNLVYTKKEKNSHEFKVWSSKIKEQGFQVIELKNKPITTHH